MQLGLDTWDRVLENLKSGQVVLENESELKYYFFHCCLTLMEKEGFKTPYSVFAEDTMEIRKKNSPKCDMVLGEAVTIEFKHKVYQYRRNRVGEGRYSKIRDIRQEWQGNLWNLLHD